MDKLEEDSIYLFRLLHLNVLLPLQEMLDTDFGGLGNPKVSTVISRSSPRLHSTLGHAAAGPAAASQYEIPSVACRRANQAGPTTSATTTSYH